jgi:predicted small integral membrane protein
MDYTFPSLLSQRKSMNNNWLTFISTNVCLLVIYQYCHYWCIQILKNTYACTPNNIVFIDIFRILKIHTHVPQMDYTFPSLLSQRKSMNNNWLTFISTNVCLLLIYQYCLYWWIQILKNTYACTPTGLHLSKLVISEKINEKLTIKIS